jgi:hypothetical protein
MLCLLACLLAYPALTPSARCALGPRFVFALRAQSRLKPRPTRFAPNGAASMRVAHLHFCLEVKRGPLSESAVIVFFLEQRSRSLACAPEIAECCTSLSSARLGMALRVGGSLGEFPDSAWRGRH